MPFKFLTPEKDWNTILGIVVLREAQGARRLIAAGLTTVGAMLLGLFR